MNSQQELFYGYKKCNRAKQITSVRVKIAQLTGPLAQEVESSCYLVGQHYYLA